MSNQIVLSACLAAAVCVLPHQCLAYTWAIEGNGIGLDGGGTSVIAMNNKGQVVGSSGTYFWGEYVTRAFLYENGQTKSLGSLGGPGSVANGINNQGEIVGDSDITTWPGRSGFIYRDGQIEPFSGGDGLAINDAGTILTPRGLYYRDGHVEQIRTRGFRDRYHALNNNNQVVGATCRTDHCGQSRMYGYIYSGGGGLEEFSMPGYLETYPTDINDAGVAVGGAYNDDNRADSVAFIYRNGVFETIPGLNGFVSFAEAINNRGDVIGSYVTEGPYGKTNNPFLYRDGVLIDLNRLDMDYSIFDDGRIAFVDVINDHGQMVVGTRWGTHFLLSPVPEPETYAIFLSGLGMVYLARRRKRPLTMD